MVKSNSQLRHHGDELAGSNEGPAVDLFREKSRYFKRIGNNYQLGSNIACLHSHELESKEPPKPSHRVRNIGREIMLNANICSWYQGMTEGVEDEEIRGRRRPPVKTRTTSASLLCPQDEQVSPKPVHTEHPRRPNPIIPSPEPETVQSYPSPRPVQPSPLESSPFVHEKEAVVEAEEIPREGIEETLTTSSSVCSLATSEANANMCLLKRLEEQQLELMKQQLALSERLGLQLKGHNKRQTNVAKSVQPKPAEPKDSSVAPSKEASTTSDVTTEEPSEETQTETTEKASVTQSASMSHSRYDMASQRRLKGAVAQRCAQRDEGSIKNLIWYQEEDTDDGDGNNNKITRIPSIGSCSSRNFLSLSHDSPMRVVRKSSCAVKAENSKTIQDLLTNSFSSTFS